MPSSNSRFFLFEGVLSPLHQSFIAPYSLGRTFEYLEVTVSGRERNVVPDQARLSENIIVDAEVRVFITVTTVIEFWVKHEYFPDVNKIRWGMNGIF